MSNMCDYCGVRPKYYDSATGKTHDFCGRTCALQAKASMTNLCIECGLKPKFDDGVKAYNYCGKTCAQEAKARGGGSLTSADDETCKFCKVRPRESRGTWTFAFCSKTCASRACKYCNEYEKEYDPASGKTLDYCSESCARKDRSVNGNTTGKKPGIVELSPGYHRFQSVAHQFEVTWRHPTTCPPVSKIYQIIGDAPSVDAYTAYKQALENAEDFQSQNLAEGNEERRWHGTKRACQLGDPGHTKLCTHTSCSLCNIIRNSFDLKHFGERTGWGRFGCGLYTSSTSSKSNDYAKNTHSATSSPFKAMILSKVAVGRAYKSKQNMENATKPPRGYDSVVGEVGKALNYDELIVYRSDAIIPVYLVIYG
ncbi:ADP-ribosylation [Stereum hirsutum FP-91666 SS1]|uniref:ADP-ribosylation n=1 Tax=Stereum hirsutum (strain FP-91666) TaxID=721885 RepID=UPI000440A86B|nr:ADP-ribosylation [Stereum hirsutum FP-91666 SS1]EIM89175.1 ADP-ribosylation [Stereum hirsutum FP-91666 SS1]